MTPAPSLMLQQRLNSLSERRANAPPLPSGVSPFTSSDLFKSPARGGSAPPKQWDRFWSIEASARSSSSLKIAASTPRARPMISLGVGRPIAENMPWTSLEVSAIVSTSDKDKVNVEPKQAMVCSSDDKEFNLGDLLNYGYSAGSPQLLRFVTEHVELVHNPPNDDWQCCLTCGTTSAVDILVRMFCNRGDWILMEEHTYPGTMETIRPLGIRICSIRMDKDGLVPEDLDSKLQGWDLKQGPKPTILYIIPCGQNPTGITQPLERRKAIYEVAEKHDLCIIEDDPYYFLQLQTDFCETDSQPIFSPETRQEFLDSLPTSYLSLDRSGRVIRLDTTSKILAPGIRCGWLSASSQVVAKYMTVTDFSVLTPSGPSQVMVYNLLDKSWGHEGFLNWLLNLSNRYRRRLNILVQACERNLPLDICRWDIPIMGMFIWVQIDWSLHPDYSPDDNAVERRGRRLEIEERLYEQATDDGVNISKGSWFDGQTESTGPIYIRLTFAATAEDTLEEAIVRLGSAIRTEFGIAKLPN